MFHSFTLCFCFICVFSLSFHVFFFIIIFSIRFQLIHHVFFSIFYAPCISLYNNLMCLMQKKSNTGNIHEMNNTYNNNRVKKNSIKMFTLGLFHHFLNVSILDLTLLVFYCCCNYYFCLFCS